MASKRTWWIAIGCGGLLFLAVAFFGIVAFVVMRSLDIKPASAESAEHEYAELRNRFQGKPALIEVDPNNLESLKVNRRPESTSAARVDRVQIFGWAPREKKVFRLALPLWLLRLKANGGAVAWEWGQDVRIENLNVTVEDIERQGPGLILDFEDRKGNRVLVWSE
jgi:hypothetical protein